MEWRFFLQVSAREAGAGSTTRDVDAAIRREDLTRIIEVAEENGFRYRHSAGIDMLLDVNQPTARTAIHLANEHEKVRPEYVESVPGFSEATISVEGVLIAPVADLVRMKLTSFREKDRVHVRDLDSVGLITPEIEAGLSDVLRARLAQVRATE